MTLGDQVAHARLQDRTASGGQHLNLDGVDVDTNDTMACTRPASGAHRAHITQPEDADRQAQMLVLPVSTDSIASIVHTDNSEAGPIDLQPLLSNRLPRITPQLRASVERQARS